MTAPLATVCAALVLAFLTATYSFALLPSPHKNGRATTRTQRFPPQSGPPIVSLAAAVERNDDNDSPRRRRREQERQLRRMILRASSSPSSEFAGAPAAASAAATEMLRNSAAASSRRKWLRTAALAVGGSLSSPLLHNSLRLTEPGTTAATAVAVETKTPAARIPLEELLYRILRVREATQQETRLIRTGKFKDVQRANVKLAIKFMIENYRLADAFVQSSTYLEGGSARRVEAGQVGQGAVQSLYTILEYFDAADVQNIKVGNTESMSGKEDLVLKGLDSARDSIDAFIKYFPSPIVESVNARIRQENELNVKEFDPALGSIINLPPMP